MELNRVPYLKLVKSEERLGGAYRVFFKFACRLPACGFDIAMAELGRIWLDLSSGTDSVHTIRQVGDGFEFCFVELTPVGQWISGLIVVEPAPVPELQKPKKFMLKLR